MRARAAILVEPNSRLVVDEVELPDPDPDQVIVRVQASGVCHTQIHQIHRRPAPGAPMRLPTLLGHESVGTVVATGHNVGNVQEGDHVLTTWVDRNNADGTLPPVGHATTERPQPKVRWQGREVFAPAATWTDHLIASSRLVVRLDDPEPTDVMGIIGCAVMTGAGAIINTLNVRSGESIAVFGVGGVGLCALSAAAIVDAYPIIAVDVSDEKLAFAKQFGATHTVRAGETAVAAIRELTDGGVHYAIDAIGLAITQRQILEVVRQGYPGGESGGMALLLGVTPPGVQVTLDTSLFSGGRRFTRALGGECRPDRDFSTFVRWYRQGKLKLDELVTRRYELDQINQAVDDLEQGRVSGRSIVTFG